MDAFAHCLEAYCSPFYHPMSQGIALEGLRLVNEYLPRAYADGTDLEARANMMSAAAMGAVAFQKGLGAIHALSHPVGALYNTHHGTTNAVVMPAVLRFNRPAVEDRLAAAAAYLGIKGGSTASPPAWTNSTPPSAIPKGLGAMGVEESRLDDLTAMALEDPSVGGNPVAMTQGEHARAVPRRDVKGAEPRWPRPRLMPQARRAASRATSPMLSREMPRSARSRSVRTDSSSKVWR
jgi:alcohol dehydrogenase